MVAHPFVPKRKPLPPCLRLPVMPPAVLVNGVVADVDPPGYQRNMVLMCFWVTTIRCMPTAITPPTLSAIARRCLSRETWGAVRVPIIPTMSSLMRALNLFGITKTGLFSVICQSLHLTVSLIFLIATRLGRSTRIKKSGPNRPGVMRPWWEW